jgi:hypothetical protein
MTLIRYAGFTVAALVGFAIQANAETTCLELGQLRSVAAEASKEVTRDPVSIRCGSYHRLARAAEAIVDYAQNNRESCGISAESLEHMERYHRVAVRDRDNFCAGRPLLPRPLDVRPMPR